MILAIDIGSTQMKLLLMDEAAQVVDLVAERYGTLTLKAGWVEQNPEDWSKAFKKGIKKLKEKRKCKQLDIDCISFSGHMSSVIPVDMVGKPLMNCIMLSDSRSAKQCKEIEKIVGGRIAEVTGNPVKNVFSLPKILWIYENKSDVYKGMFQWISAKDYLRFMLTGKLETEYTDAYNSIAEDPNTLQYDSDIIKSVGLDLEKFPEIHNPYEIAGKVTKEASEYFGIQEGVPVSYGAADMACAAIGNTLFQNGDSTLTLGTSATFFAMLPERNPELFGKVTYHLHAEKNKFYTLGSHFNGGLAANFITGILNSNGKSDFQAISELSLKAEKISPGSGGLITIPFLAGSGSPYFNENDRQSILFLNPSTTREEIFRSELEGISYNLKETYELYCSILGNINNIILGGGGVNISIWPQILSDVFNTNISISENADASTIGAAIIGGKACGMFSDVEETAKKILKVKKEIHPNSEAVEKYKVLYQKYLHCYKALQTVYNSI